MKANINPVTMSGKIILLFSLLITSFSGISQDTSKINPLRRQLSADSAHIYRFKKLRPQVAIDNRNSFIREAAVNVKGLTGGVVINEKYSVGLGIYGIKKNTLNPKTAEKTSPTSRNLSLGYFSAYFEYAVIDKKYWEVGFPLEIGVGGYNVSITDSAGKQILSEKKGGIIPIQAGVDASFKPIRWAGINVYAGYRYVAVSNPNFNFNGVFYSIGLQLYLREIIRDTRYYIKKKEFREKVKDITAAEGKKG